MLTRTWFIGGFTTYIISLNSSQCNKLIIDYGELILILSL